MEGFGPTSYGDGFADVYDDWYGDVSDADATAGFVVAVAGDDWRPVVELGVGTGRLAAPIVARGRAVVGVDASAAMLRHCRQAAPAVAAVRADMMAPPIRAGSASVVLVGFNTLFNLTSDGAQARCLAWAAAAIAPEGAVVIEAFVPAGDAGDDHGDRVEVVRLDVDRVVLRVSRTQDGLVSGHHVDLRHGEPVRLRPWMVRFRTPEDLDRLAGDSGLVLAARHGGWHREPFDATSSSHVSVYRPCGT